MQPWQELMREVALHRNVYCKLSGMMTEADPLNWSIEQLRPYADHVMEQFGAERVMFGSDWPVCLLAASYEEVLTATRTLVTSGLGSGAEEAVFGDNAARFYRLDPAGATHLTRPAHSRFRKQRSCVDSSNDRHRSLGGNRFKCRSSSQKSSGMGRLSN